MAGRVLVGAVVTLVALTGCGGADLAGVGGAEILSFADDLHKPVTFSYCPEQGCGRPLVHKVKPGQSWRVASQTINGAGAVSIEVAGKASGCKLVPAVGFVVDSLLVIKASEVKASTPVACVSG